MSEIVLSNHIDRINAAMKVVDDLERDGAKILAAFRKRYGLSLSGLEKLTGIQRSNLCAMERGKRKVSMAVLHKLIDAEKRLNKRKKQA